jgi:hypothetical protein
MLLKKLFSILFTGGLLNMAMGQEVIISGVNKNRLLTWADFTGTIDKSSEHDANTYWKIKYGFTGVGFKGDTAKLQGLYVKLELDKDHSWVKQNKATDNLLKHEQGHFDTGLLCLQELIDRLNNTVFFKADFMEKIKTAFSGILAKYTQMGITYDTETNHSKNEQQQDKWNIFFAQSLQK